MCSTPRGKSFHPPYTHIPPIHTPKQYHAGGGGVRGAADGRGRGRAVRAGGDAFRGSGGGQYGGACVEGGWDMCMLSGMTCAGTDELTATRLRTDAKQVSNDEAAAATAAEGGKG